MAQIGIREYDAKRMFFESVGQNYSGVQVRKLSDLGVLEAGKKYVIKPDMLFGKRGKLGLLGVGLTKNELESWFREHKGKQLEINGVTGTLEVFLVEDFVPHDDEYYISFTAKKDADELHFSRAGGVEIEENWEQVETLALDVLETSLDLSLLELEKNVAGIIEKLHDFYKNYGFSYLEVNPFCFDTNGNIVLLDMVAKIDDQEHFRQKNNWKDLEFPKSFGSADSEAEYYINKLDSETGASLKFKILNENAAIWTLLAGGGGSLVFTDTLGALGFASEIGNYGELSGNPTRDFTREYARTVIEVMLASNAPKKYFVIGGAIANFTDVAKTFAGIIDVLKEKAEEFREQNIQILVRRGGINEKEGLANLASACSELGIDCTVADSSEYMTDILREIQL